MQPHGSPDGVVSACRGCHEEVSGIILSPLPQTQIFSLSSEWEKDIGRDMSGYLLPGLQKLRQICNYATEDSVLHFEDRDPRVTESNAESETEEFYYEEELPKKRKGESASSALPKKSKKTKAGTQALIGDSTKLQVTPTLSCSPHLDPPTDLGGFDPNSAREKIAESQRRLWKDCCRLELHFDAGCY
jgi:hypothetical protein